MTEHTPGPWACDAVMSEAMHDIILDYEIPGAGRPIVIASVYVDEQGGEHPTIKQANANARLIAAAPELLAACETVSEMFTRFGLTAPDQSVIGKVRRAIAKAIGTP